MELQREKEKFYAQKTILESSYTVTEGRFAVAHEQVISAQEEALEWKQKYDIAAGEAKAGLERSGLVQEWANDKALEREDVIREEWGTELLEKVNVFFAYILFHDSFIRSLIQHLLDAIGRGNQELECKTGEH